MGLDRLVRNAVATAKRVTGSLLVEVTVKRRTTDGGGNLEGENRKKYPALVEQRVKRFQVDGVEVASRAKVTFLEHVDVEHPDVLILPGGRVCPILSVEQLFDHGRPGKGFFTQLYVG
jgi:hypothetical protein